MTGRFPIEDVTPSVSCGRYPAKAVVGELVPVSAVSYREGHHALGVNVVWRGPDGEAEPFTRMQPGRAGPRPVARRRSGRTGSGRWTFTVEAFDDPYRTWRDAVVKKIGAGQGVEDLANDLAEGADVLDLAAKIVPARGRGPGPRRGRRAARRAALAVRPGLPRARPGGTALAQPGAPAGDHHPVVRRSGSTASARSTRRGTSSSPAPRAPRSARTRPRSSTARSPPRPQRIPAVAAMGFDVLYLPPIHPIGKVNRKGRNNTLVAAPGGRRLAVGDRLGRGRPRRDPPATGHPGGLPRVRRRRRRSTAWRSRWTSRCRPRRTTRGSREHPEFFTTRADGTIAYAENPPKKYQDIYPLNWDNDYRRPARRGAARRPALGRAGRQDLPGRQPAHQGAQLLAVADRQGQGVRPGRAVPGRGVHPAGHDERARQDRLHPVVHVLHLAHHRPGRCASTWASCSPRPDWMRPNFWPNTPDILHESLQHGGPPMFKIRAVLASMLSPSWGMYSGLRAVRARRPPGRRGVHRQREVRAEAARLGRRRAHRPVAGAVPRPGSTGSATRTRPCTGCATCGSTRSTTPRCCASPSATRTPATPFWWSCRSTRSNVQWGNTTLDMPALGMDWHERFTVTDQITGATYDWGQHNAVRIDPYVEPAHVFVVQRASLIPVTCGWVGGKLMDQYD